MSFNRAGLKCIGGEGKAYNEGKIFSYISADDTLGTILASGYFDSISNDLDTEYMILCKGTDGMLLARFTVSGTTVSWDGDAESISGAGAASVTEKTTLVTTTGADAVTLADGVYVGQIKVIILVVDGGTMTLTPANALGWTTCTFADAGDSITLQWTAGGWALIGQGGLTTGPLTA